MTGFKYGRLSRERKVRVGGATFTNDAVRRVYLAVPFEMRGVAKALGARWDAVAKRWFCLLGTEAASALLGRFGRARPRKQRARASTSRLGASE